ncbi:MAG TPA: hypothetical protein VFH72_12585, partial [Candidatus Baltobacteraceae bacterium]|nr:hypothetical protein [Candidatus Baltobacteraceae bacterium]
MDGKWRRTCARSAEPTLLAQPAQDESSVSLTFFSMGASFDASKQAPVKKNLLFIPGPVTVPEQVLAAMSKPL